VLHPFHLQLLIGQSSDLCRGHRLRSIQALQHRTQRLPNHQNINNDKELSHDIPAFPAFLKSNVPSGKPAS
jgi:hypothetical protein